MSRVCTFCVMDDSGTDITFDDRGECDCCRAARARMRQEWHPGAEGQRRLGELVERLKNQGRGRAYDCMVGLSGGVDSAYLVHFLRRVHGLRMLAVHVDGGWNSEAAVRNIEVLVRRLDLDLHTYVVEWDEMRDLQIAFLRSSVFNQDMPQDHAFFTTLYRSAVRFGIRDFLSGVNFASECVTPTNWGYPSMDGRHVRAIHDRFGAKALDTFPIMSIGEYVWLTRVRRQLLIHRPLNFLPYDKEAAKRELSLEYGWKDYGGKHHESRFTKFYQEVYLSRKANFDKRRLHLSSLIVSGQLSRTQALAELKKPLCDPGQARRDVAFVAKKLGINLVELDKLCSPPLREHESYPNSRFIFRLGAAISGWWSGRREKPVP